MAHSPSSATKTDRDRHYPSNRRRRWAHTRLGRHGLGLHLSQVQFMPHEPPRHNAPAVNSRLNPARPARRPGALGSSQSRRARVKEALGPSEGPRERGSRPRRTRSAIRPSEWSKAYSTAGQASRSASAPMDPGPTKRASPSRAATTPNPRRSRAGTAPKPPSAPSEPQPDQPPSIPDSASPKRQPRRC